MNYKIIKLFILITLSFNIKAQQVLHCGQQEAYKRLFDKDQSLKQQFYQSKIKTERVINQTTVQLTGTKKVIPVVFHIVHTYGIENISDAQVYSAIDMLNNDYTLNNSDTSDIVPSFKNLKGNANIIFRLARKDPNGNCTNGINRIYSTLTNTGEDNVKEGTQWDPSRYLNIWVVKAISFGAAGYAYYASTADFWPDLDGIVILHNYVGSIGTSNYFQGRALTHEVGHYLELQHVWGDTNNPGVACGDDQVSDTPITKGWSQCNLNASVCTPGIIENVQNYMEYAYCGRMFTIGQVNRMLSILNSTIANRNNLWSPANLLFTGTDSVTYFNPPLCKPIADFKVDKKIVCPNQSVQFTDLSYNEQPTQWTWFFEGGNPSYSNDQNPTVTYLHGGNYRVKLIVSNLAGNDSLIRDHYILVLNDSVIHQNYYYENFEHFNPELSFFTFDKESQTQWQVDSINANSSCLMLRNYLLQQSEKTFFITPAINISSIPSPILSFRVAFKQISNSTENNLRVFANQNCNSTWFLRYNKNGTYLQTVTDTNTSEFFPQSDADWRYENVVINNVASGSQVRFKFEYNNESGNNIFIDDINVYSLVTGEKFPLLSLTDEIYLYPNPTQQTNSVSIKNLQSGNLAIYIYDISGRLIFQKNETINTHNYTLNSLNEIVNNKGLYIFRIINNQHVCNKPLIIN